MFSTDGFDRASLKQIAEDAGLTRNAIANYYPNKVDLYVAALASIQEVAIPRILAEAAAVERPVHRRIMTVVETATAFSGIDETFIRFFVTASVDATHHPELRERALLPVATVRDFIQDALDTAQRQGEIDPATDTEATTRVIIDLLWGLALDTGFHPAKERIERTVQALDRLLAAALVPVANPSPARGRAAARKPVPAQAPTPGDGRRGPRR